MYLPDTNIFILASKSHEPEASFLTEVKTENLFISTMVVAEFLANSDNKDTKAFKKLISELEILPVDQGVAEQAAQYRKQMKQKSKRVVLIDCLIAAQAKLHNLILVTNDKKDFPMKDIKVLSPKEVLKRKN